MKKNAKKIVKSKSMVSTEVDIDPMLVSLADDMEILETDLAEFILQITDWDEAFAYCFSSFAQKS
nr:hypothetical protein [Lactococcus garvieae]